MSAGSSSRILISPDDATKMIDTIAPVRLHFLKRWGLSIGPMHTWRRNGIPMPAAYAVKFAHDRLTNIWPAVDGGRPADQGRLQSIIAAAEAAGRGGDVDQVRDGIATKLRAGEELPITVGQGMPPEVIKQAMDLLGYSRDGFADTIGTTRRSVDRWLAGASPIDPGISWMLRATLADRCLELDFGDPLDAALADLAHDYQLRGWSPEEAAAVLETDYEIAPVP